MNAITLITARNNKSASGKTTGSMPIIQNKTACTMSQIRQKGSGISFRLPRLMNDADYEAPKAPPLMRARRPAARRTARFAPYKMKAARLTQQSQIQAKVMRIPP